MDFRKVVNCTGHQYGVFSNHLAYQNTLSPLVFIIVMEWILKQATDGGAGELELLG